MRSEKGPQLGFTLVEVLVALTIGSLLVVATVSATRSLTSARAAVDRRAARVGEARRAMEAIVGGLRNVRRDPIAGKPLIIGRSGGRGAGQDAITFLAMDGRRVRAEGAESDQYETSFRLSGASAGKLPVLMCRRDHAFDEYPEEGGVVTVVAEGIVALSFEYYAQEQWFPEWPATEPKPPEAVRVTLVAATAPEPGSKRTPDTTVLSSVVTMHANQPEEQPKSGGNDERKEGANPGGPQMPGGPPG